MALPEVSRDAEDCSERSQSSVIIATQSFANPSEEVREKPAESAWGIRRRFFLPIIAPGALQGKANQVVAPILPIFVREDLHASDTVVGLLLATAPIANICLSVPAGLVIERLNFGTAACMALGGLIAVSAASYFAPSILFFFFLRFLNGAFLNLFDMSRKTWLAAEVPSNVRSRITATIAGCNKLAVIVASLLGGLFAQYISNRSIFLLQGGFSLVALLLVVLFLSNSGSRSRDATIEGTQNQTDRRGNGQLRTSEVFKSHWKALVKCGGFCALLSGIRNAWNLLLPLQAHNSSQNKQTIGILVASVRATEVLITLTVAGQFMDRFGRKCTAVPAVCLMGLAHGITPLCKSTATLLIAAVIYGIGNGLSGGIIMAYQTALAPKAGRSQFIALFKIIQSSGGLVMPPLLGWISDFSGSLETGALCIAGSSAFTVLWLLLVVSEDSYQPGRHEQRMGHSLVDVRQVQ